MQSVERISSILLAFTSDEQELGVTEIARRLDLPKSAVYRFLDSLVETGLVTRDQTSSRYRLGPKAIELGLAAIGARDLQTMALPIMQDLVKQTSETATLSLAVGRERVYAAQVEGPQVVRMTVAIGPHYPLYAGASGRAILAFLQDETRRSYLDTYTLTRLTDATLSAPKELEAVLDDVRVRGYAFSRGERDPAAAAVAAPLFGSLERVIGSLSICGPITRFSDEQIERYGPLVQTAARSLSEQT
jgi:IclR family transcriptional regulator, acetate operon repressor